MKTNQQRLDEIAAAVEELDRNITEIGSKFSGGRVVPLHHDGVRLVTVQLEQITDNARQLADDMEADLDGSE